MSASDVRIVLQPVRDLVLVPLRGPVHAELMEELRSKILDYLHARGARGVVIDMAGVEVLDEYDFEILRRVAESAGLMGAPVILAGIRPGVAAGLTMLGVDDHWVTASRTVDQAMERLS